MSAALVGYLSGQSAMIGYLSGQSSIQGLLSIPSRIGDPYEGEYEIYPTTEEQILPTEDRNLTENIIIHPIPSNYGLITWDGATLTVS